MTNMVGMSEKATKVARFLGYGLRLLEMTRTERLNGDKVKESMCRTPSVARSLKDDGTGHHSQFI
jgi:hypothetical protein